MGNLLKNLKVNKIVVLALIIAAVLRFWRVDVYPALNADEAAIGYNAYSLVTTGLDEHGNSWPIHFQSFNDWKPGLYFYLVLPFVRFMDLSLMSVRVPNIILSIASVYVLHLLVRKLFPDLSVTILGTRVHVGDISALFLAISPWHIHFSRGGWEVNTATFFVLTGLYLVLSGIKDKFNLRVIIPGVLSLVLSLYTYHAVRIVAPLIVFGIAAIFARDIFIKENTKKIIAVLIVGLMFMFPLVKDFASGGALSRAAGVGLFADKGPINRINEQRGEHSNLLGPFAKLTHNKFVNFGLAFLDNWSAHFQGEFLFMTGDSIQRNKVPETGVMYLVDIIFLGFGIYFLSKNMNKSAGFLVFWLIVAPVAAALTFQSPHSLRAENMVIPLVIISSIGFVELLNRISLLGRYRNFLFFTVLVAVLWCLGRYLHMYYNHMSKEYPYSSQYGVGELVSYVQSTFPGKSIYVTDRYDQPYILFLFYTKYPPSKFQFKHTLTSRDDYGFSTVRDYDNLHFVKMDFQSIKNEFPGAVIVGTPSEIPIEANIVKRIYGSNGFEYFDVVAN